MAESIGSRLEINVGDKYRIIYGNKLVNVRVTKIEVWASDTVCISYREWGFWKQAHSDMLPEFRRMIVA